MPPRLIQKEAPKASPIPLRPLEPTSDTRPGAGHVDEIAAKLAAVRSTIETMPDDKYSAALEPACVEATNALERVRRAHWGWSDSLQKIMAAQTGFTRARQEQAAAAVPQTGNGAPIEFETKVRAAANGVEADVRRTAIGQVFPDATKAEAAQLATAAADALRALDVEVVRAKDDHTGPAQLRGDESNTLEELFAVGSLQTELRSYEPRKLFGMFAGYVERGDTEKAERFQRAARSLLLDWKVTPAVKLGAMWRPGGNEGRTDQGAAHHEWVWKLLAAFDKYRADRMPKSIPVAEAVYVALREIFWIACGMHASFLDAATFRREYLDGNAAAADPLRVDENWPQRYLPGGRVSLPGWSPVIAKSAATGVKVRAPREG